MLFSSIERFLALIAPALLFLTSFVCYRSKSKYHFSNYTGFAKDEESLRQDRAKVAGDMQRGWAKTKEHFGLK